MSLGLGSVIATFIEAAPWLTVVGRYKGTVFTLAGLMLAVNFWLVVERPRHVACAPGEVCHIDSPAMRAARVLFWTSVVIWAVAVSFSYAALWWVRMQ